MALRLSLWFLLQLTHLRVVTAACSGSPPLSLPIANVDLSDGHTMRGIPMSIGSPPQNVSFLPHTFLNNTWVYNASSPFCMEDTTKAQCRTIRGGTFDPSSSTSASDSLDVYGAGGDPSDTLRTLGTHIWYNDWAQDTLKAGNITLDDFPIGMPGFDVGGVFDTQANIGLGRNSTLLNALYEAGHVSSRTYSFWWGRNSASPENSMDGQLVFGGYDAAKVMGPNITQKLLPSTTGCGSGMYLTMTNMILGFPNGTKAEMLAPSILSACVQLDFPAVATFRYDPFMERFQNYTDTVKDETPSGQPWEVFAYRLDGQYGGDLSFVLDGTSKYTLSNDILILPAEYVASDGDFKTDSSSPGIVFAPTSDGNVNDVAIVGRPFFSAAYIMVDLDAETWTLWQANATTDTQLVSVGEDCAERPKVNMPPPKIVPPGTIATNETSTNDADDAATSALLSDKSAGMGAGAIAGIAVGAVFASGLLAGFLAICWLRGRSRRGRRRSDTGIALTDYGHSHEGNHLAQIWYEKSADSAQELPSSRMLTHELSVNERPVEASNKHWDGHFVELPVALTPKP